ncbi:acetolactate decarboxylase [Fundidesulfovibrio agrisoli]|uniref:acetolactate decarboxylase n=1 Tax=Fundidesulfovibrio agrisoli TaxID=2922717 RepID=UPI001FABE3A3
MTSARRLLLPVLLLLLAACAPKQTTPALYQYAVFDSFAAGEYAGSISLDALRAHGDFGLGTFHGLDGEMIVLDGVIYRADANLSLSRPAGATLSPFADLVFFKPASTLDLSGVATLKELGQALDARLPKDGFAAVRIEGTFSRLLIRSVPISQPPYPDLGQALLKQNKKELLNARGTLIALRAPDQPTGAWVAGWHFHFVSQDKTTGGHTLEASVDAAQAGIMPIRQFELELPPRP